MPSSSSKPALVIVPGACHHPSHYFTFASRLESAGYDTTTIDLPSTGGPKPTTLQQDIDAIRAAILPYLERGRDVAIIMHSFGGITGSPAVQGLTSADRGEGAASVVKLIFLCALIADAGNPAIPVGGSHAPTVHFPLPDPKDEGWMFFHDPANTFYAECAPDVREEAVGKLRLCSEGIAHEVSPYAGYRDVDSYYLICEKDQALPAVVQEMWSQSAGGRWIKVERLATDHSPFLSRPEETVAFVERCIADDS